MKTDSENVVALSVFSFAIFETWKIYEKNAPTLAICRAASDDRTTIEHSDVLRQLNDTDLVVASLGLGIGAYFSITLKNGWPLALIAGVLLMLSMSRRKILESVATSKPR